MSAEPQSYSGKIEAPVLDVTCALIVQTGRVLTAQRADNGLWELPGGKVEPGEDLRSCLVREIREELGARITVLDLLHSLKHPRKDDCLVLHCFLGALQNGQCPRALEHKALRWVFRNELGELNLCSADSRMFGILLAHPTLRGRWS